MLFFCKREMMFVIGKPDPDNERRQNEDLDYSCLSAASESTLIARRAGT